MSTKGKPVPISSWQATRWDMIYGREWVNIDLSSEGHGLSQVGVARRAAGPRGTLDFTLHYNMPTGKVYTTGIESLDIPGAPRMLHIYAFGNRVYLPSGRLRLRNIHLSLQTTDSRSPKIEVYEISIKFAKHFPVELRQ